MIFFPFQRWCSPLMCAPQCFTDTLKDQPNLRSPNGFKVTNSDGRGYLEWAVETALMLEAVQSGDESERLQENVAREGARIHRDGRLSLHSPWEHTRVQRRRRREKENRTFFTLRGAPMLVGRIPKRDWPRSRRPPAPTTSPCTIHPLLHTMVVNP